MPQTGWCDHRAVHNFFSWGVGRGGGREGNVISLSRTWPPCSCSGGMLPPGSFGNFRCSEAYREAHIASWEKTQHHNHHYLLSYWKPSPIGLGEWWFQTQGSPGIAQVKSCSIVVITYGNSAMRHSGSAACVICLGNLAALKLPMG